MLDSVDATVALVRRLEQRVTDTIWIGKMQRIPVFLNAHVPGFEAARNLSRSQQTDAEILRLGERLGNHAKVKWKASEETPLRRAFSRRQYPRKQIRAYVARREMSPRAPSTSVARTSLRNALPELPLGEESFLPDAAGL